MSEHPKVFISYSHENSEYENRILEFANRLRAEGIDANIDLYEEAPAEGWPRWMENQINDADYVLVVSSRSYFEKIYLEKNRGKGISWEVNVVYQHIYDASSLNTKFIPVYFYKEEEQYILTPLKPFTFYSVGDEEGFEKLYWRLRGVTKNQKPPLGNLRPLPEKEQKTMFFSTPISLDKWNAAEWKVMLYLFYPGKVSVLGLLYQNYTAAKSIFTGWKKDSKGSFADDFLKIDYIIPPFPKSCWVYSDKDRSYGKGYFVHVGPNTEESIDRALASGISPEELLVTSISRYQWMDELNGSENRELFKQLTSNGSGYLLMPIGIKDKNKKLEESNLIIDFDYAIQMKNVTFKTGLKIEDNDLCKVVLKKAEDNLPF